MPLIGAVAKRLGLRSGCKQRRLRASARSLLLVPGAGIEPARIAPLVFETSASTDSAIRAGVLSGCLWAFCFVGSARLSQG